MNVTMTRRSFPGATACTASFAGTGFGDVPSKTEITFLNPRRKNDGVLRHTGGFFDIISPN